MTSPSPNACTAPRTLLVRIVAIDYYMAAPMIGVDACISHLDGSCISQVPVVRIFGSTPTGQKACVHLHRVRHNLSARLLDRII
jgi:hypothetical protein